MSNFNDWFMTFLEEKEIDMGDFVKCKDGTCQLGMVCSFILSFDDTTKSQVKNTLVAIDFKNGDVIKFLEYIALKCPENFIYS